MHAYLETSWALSREDLILKAGAALRHEAVGARRNAAAADIASG